MSDSFLIDTISGKRSRFGTIAALIAEITPDPGRAWRTFETWQERSRQRRMLAGLDAATLKDIGVSEADAWAEARKPGWRR